MKGIMKYLALVGSTAAVTATSLYLLEDKNARKKVGKKMIKTMNKAEDTVAKTMY